MASSIWYWCADQVIVQRTLSAKNISHAKAGCVLASLLKFLPLFLLVFPGMAARVLFTNEVSIATDYRRLASSLGVSGGVLGPCPVQGDLRLGVRVHQHRIRQARAHAHAPG